MKVTSWNLLHGQTIPTSGQAGGATTVGGIKDQASHRSNLAKVANMLSGDVIGVQEVDEFAPRSGNYCQVELLAQDLKAPYWAYARTVIGTPGFSWRSLGTGEQKLHTQDGRSEDSLPSYGIGLISHIPVVKWHHLELGKSIVGLPLAFPSEKGIRLQYVKDEPRIAIAAELENGYTIAVTHLSFVPGVNIYQLRKVQRWLSKMPGKHILMGDLNLPFDIPTKVSRWRSLQTKNTYPSWGAKIQFDYLLSDNLDLSRVKSLEINNLDLTGNLVSDHLPIAVEITD